jgi:hypothetical protein
MDRKKEIRDVQDVFNKGGYCSLCGYSDEFLILHKHHIAGRKHSDITVTVCPNCHERLSLEQRAWPSIWLKKTVDQNIIYGLMLRGLADLSKIMSEQLRKCSDFLLSR